MPTINTIRVTCFIVFLPCELKRSRGAQRHWPVSAQADQLGTFKRARIISAGRTVGKRLAKVINRDTQTVVSALIKQAKTLPNELYKSLTWDRGKELADHRRRREAPT
jgi:IS30 family transposase